MSIALEPESLYVQRYWSRRETAGRPARCSCSSAGPMPGSCLTVRSAAAGLCVGDLPILPQETREHVRAALGREAARGVEHAGRYHAERSTCRQQPDVNVHVIRTWRFGESMKTHIWRDSLHCASWTAFMVITTAVILNDPQSARVSELGLVGIAPENLRRSIDLLRFGVAVEKPAFPVEHLVSSRSYREHEARLAVYASRLELLERQSRDRGEIGRASCRERV
jgi:hypothetical protein